MFPHKLIGIIALSLVLAGNALALPSPPSPTEASA